MPRITDPPHDIFHVKKGIYLLEILASKKFRVDIKKFRDVLFPAGYYYYVGSAQKNFASRIKRHLSENKKVHWHIDHITTLKTNMIRKIYFIEDAEKDIETDLAAKLVSALNCRIIVEKFGCSDTPESVTHLVYSRKPIKFSSLQSIYKSISIEKLSEINPKQQIIKNM